MRPIDRSRAPCHARGRIRTSADRGDIAEAAVSEAPACFWCNRPFRARRTGGRSQRFCRPSCRRSFHAAARAWALNAIENGALTVADIRSGLPATRALLLAVGEPTPRFTRGTILLRLEIVSEAVAEHGGIGRHGIDRGDDNDRSP
jgi:hypothetical protein